MSGSLVVALLALAVGAAGLAVGLTFAHRTTTDIRSLERQIDLVRHNSTAEIDDCNARIDALSEAQRQLSDRVDALIGALKIDREQVANLSRAQATQSTEALATSAKVKLCETALSTLTAHLAEAIESVDRSEKECKAGRAQLESELGVLLSSQSELLRAEIVAAVASRSTTWS